MASAQAFLVQSQNADGGWGYRAGGMSYVEPTAAALLALSERDAASARQRAREFLLSLQHADGGWGIAAVDAESGWMTANSVYALGAFADARAQVERGVEWLLRLEGVRATDAAAREKLRAMYRMDSALAGWPWQVGDAAWVHPTALAITALVASGRVDHPRVRAGVDFLLDRAVETGGWNIGNPEMIGQVIPPTAQDTAVALVALRRAGVPPADGHVQSGLGFLQDVTGASTTPSELAWAIDGLAAWNVNVAQASVRLAGLQREDGSWQGSPLTTAVAMRTGQV